MSVETLRAWLQQAPPGSMVPTAAVLAELGSSDAPVLVASGATSSWRERFWTCPAETRLGVEELCEALGRGKPWVHRHTSRKAGVPLLPHRKLDGSLVFVAGEIRAWLDEQEVRCVASRAPMPARSGRSPHLRRAL